MTRVMKFGLAAAGFAAVITAVMLYDGFSGANSNAPRYRLATASRGPIAGTVSASGTLQAVVTVDVGTQVSGMIKTLHADFNSEVEAGQVIARIDSGPFEASLSQAEAELAVAHASVAVQEASLQELQAELEGLRASLTEAKEDLRRKRLLLSRDVVSSSTVDTALAKKEQASALVKAGLARLTKQKAQIELAQAQALQKTAAVQQRQLDLEYTYIRSPVNGVVISRNVDAGQTVTASLQTPVLFLIAQDLARMEVSISVDEADIGRVSVGQKVTFTVDSYSDQTFEGRVHQVRKAGQEISSVVTYTVVATADNVDHLLLPGMTANVTIIISERNGVLKIPNAAFFYHPWDAIDMKTRSDSRIWIMEDSGQPRPVSVVYGITDGNESEIVSGDLKEGQKVITGVVDLPSPAPRKWLQFGF
jgi:HlyD family secretion protein